MSVQNSQPANETTFNTSFMSREEDTNTIGRVDLDNALAESGPALANVQRELNGQASFVGDTPEGAYDRKPTWASDSIGTPNQAVKNRVDSVQAAVEANQTAISGLQGDVTDIRSSLGIADGDTDMGTYTGSIISDNVDQVTINQQLETAVEARILLSEKGSANGVATLDSGGRLPVAQLPTSAVEYKGAWNASTNTPTLADGVGDNGDLYRVSVAGTQNLGSGSITFGVGDAIIYNGSIWQRIPSDSAVTSVNGQSGIVVLDTDDISEGASNLYFTNSRADSRIAAASIDDLADVDTTTNPPATNEALIWDGSNWVPGEAVGGSGQGKKNYFEGGDFEQDIALASVYDDGGAYVNGTGGAPSAITISYNTAGPLAGVGDLEIYKTTVSGIGEGVTLLSSNIDTIDLGKDLFLEISINATDTNYTSGNYVLRAYDVTNSAIIPVVPIANLGNNGEILKAQTTIYAKVLCNPTTAQVRLSLHCNADPVPGNDFYVWVDEAVLSPGAVLVGSVITEWQEFTLNITGSVSDPTKATTRDEGAFWRRVGDSMEINYFYRHTSNVGASAGSGVYRFNLPTGYSVDYSKVEPNNGGLFVVGAAAGYFGGSDNETGVAVLPSSGNYLNIIIGNNASGDQVVGSTFRVITNATVYYTFTATVPVTQFASAGNLLSANEASVRTITAEAARSAVQSLPDSGSFTQIDFDVNVEDPFGMVNISTDRITFPYRGRVTIDGSITFASNANGDRGVGIAINGVETRRVFARPNTVNSTSLQVQRTRNVNAGDYATLLGFQQGSGGPLNATGNLLVKYEPDFSIFGLTSQTEIRSVTSAEKTPVGSNHYHQLTGNSVTLPVGDWRLSGSALFINSGVTPTYSTVAAGFYGSNGADTSSVPSSLTTIPGLTQLNSVPTQLGLYLENGGGMANAGSTIPMRIIRLSQPATIFVVTFSTQTTSANARIYASITAERIR